MSDRLKTGTSLFMALFFLVLAVGPARGAKKPYVTIFKDTVAGGYVAGVKYPGERTLYGNYAVQRVGTIEDGSGKLCVFETIDGGTRFYTNIPPGGDVEKGKNFAEHFANGLVYLITANVPVVKIEKDGAEVGYQSWINAQDKPADYEAEEVAPEGDYAVVQIPVVVFTFKKKIRKVEDVQNFSPSDFDEKGLLKQEVFLKWKKYLRVVEVENSAYVRTFYTFVDQENKRDVFYMRRFRTEGLVFANFDPNKDAYAEICAMGMDSLTPEQWKYVSANCFGKFFQDAGRLLKKGVNAGKGLFDDAKESTEKLLGEKF